jgi:hypothetical protein
MSISLKAGEIFDSSVNCLVVIVFATFPYKQNLLKQLWDTVMMTWLTLSNGYMK